ncbi:MAG: transcription initiation factor IIB [Nitrososphaerales archaeon]
MKDGKSETTVRCVLCKKGRIVTDPSTFEQVCVHCGFVVSVTRETLEPEWRKLGGISKRRIGPPVTLAKTNKGLSTYAGKIYREAARVTAVDRKAGEKIRKLQRGMLYYKSKDRSLAKAFGLLSRVIDKMQLPRAVSEDAAYIYRKAAARRLIKGRTIKAMICASIYAACRDLNIPRTIEDISKYCGVNKERVARYYRLIIQQLGFEAEAVDPARALPTIATKLEVSELTSRKALNLIRKAQERSIAVGKNPKVLAAAALYVASQLTHEKRKLREVTKAAGVSDVTLRNRSKELKGLINVL